MSKKPKPQVSDSQSKRDLATFERLPEKTKELMKLKEQHEKGSAPEQVDTARKIADKSSKSRL